MNNAPQTGRALRIVFPKKGRLQQDFAAVAKRAGFSCEKASERHDYGAGRDSNSEIEKFEVLCQRPGDALDALDHGVADMAVVGRDRFEEAASAAKLAGRRLGVSIMQEFSFSACSLQVLAPANITIRKPQDLAGMRVATSYPAALQKWLDNENVQGVTIVSREGGVEDCPRLGLADVVCDVVDSGNTARANGLKPCLKLFDSTAVLVRRIGPWSESFNEASLQIAGRLALADKVVYRPAYQPAAPREVARAAI